MKYRYTGQTEVYLPVQKVLVEPNDVVEVTEPIFNMEFELVEEVKPSKKLKVEE